jgi:hypothetical protein
VERWKVVAGVALLVGFGFLCGAVAATFWWERSASGHGSHGRLSSLLAPEVAEELGLDARQRQAFEAMVGEARGQLLAMRQEFRPRAAAILDGAFKRLEAGLRPEQRERLRAIRQEHMRREDGSSRTPQSRRSASGPETP